jgi:hypothetical protein
LAHMQDAALDVESNIFSVHKLRRKPDRDIIRGRFEVSNSSSATIHSQVDELTKLLKSMSAKMEKLKLEGRKTIEIHKVLITDVTSEDLTTLLRFFQGNRGTEI